MTLHGTAFRQGTVYFFDGVDPTLTMSDILGILGVVLLVFIIAIAADRHS